MMELFLGFATRITTSENAKANTQSTTNQERRSATPPGLWLTCRGPVV